MKVTLLDMYNYQVNSDRSEILIFIHGDETYRIADISTKLTASGHRAYLEGVYYSVLDMIADVSNSPTKLSVLTIKVEEIAKKEVLNG